jgi:signal peptidase II
VWPLTIVSILIVALDRILKLFIFKNIPLNSSYPLIENVIHITPVYNNGIAFGLFKGHNLFLLVAISLVTSAFIIYALIFKRPKSPLTVMGLFFILAGAIGNLIDRILYGHVLDFIDIRIWPIFNIADSAITIGVILILWSMLKRKTQNVKRKTET